METLQSPPEETLCCSLPTSLSDPVFTPVPDETNPEVQPTPPIPIGETDGEWGGRGGRAHKARPPLTSEVSLLASPPQLWTLASSTLCLSCPDTTAL